jgi:hypothetical protein
MAERPNACSMPPPGCPSRCGRGPTTHRRRLTRERSRDASRLRRCRRQAARCRGGVARDHAALPRRVQRPNRLLKKSQRSVAETPETASSVEQKHARHPQARFCSTWEGIGQGPKTYFNSLLKNSPQRFIASGRGAPKGGSASAGTVCRPCPRPLKADAPPRQRYTFSPRLRRAFLVRALGQCRQWRDHASTVGTFAPESVSSLNHESC